MEKYPVLGNKVKGKTTIKNNINKANIDVKIKANIKTNIKANVEEKMN